MIEIGVFLVGFAASFVSDNTNRFLQNLNENLKKSDPFVNHDLQKAVKCSFIKALHSIASDCHTELIKTEKPNALLRFVSSESSDDLKWLKQKSKVLGKALKDIEKEKAIDIHLDFGEIQSLISSGMLAENIIQTTKKKLITEALKENNAPVCYESKVKAELFERMSLCFAHQIKENSKISSIFDSQSLVRISAMLSALRENDLQEIKEEIRDMRILSNDLKALLISMYDKMSELNRLPKIRWQLKTTLQIHEFMNQSQHIIGQIKEYSGDTLLEPIDMDKSNGVVLVFESSQNGFERILQLSQSERLTQVIGIPVMGVEMETAIAEGSQVKKVAEMPRPLVISESKLPVSLTNSQQRRLKQKLERLEKQETLLNEKLEYLQNVYTDKADDAHKFQVKKELEGVEKELEEVENKISEIYRQMENL